VLLGVGIATKISQIFSPIFLQLNLGLGSSLRMLKLMGNLKFNCHRQPDRFPDTQGYNPQLITMLTVNYRTVPEILEVASHLFYDDQLVGQSLKFKIWINGN
jgi:hypothetical protein